MTVRLFLLAAVAFSVAAQTPPPAKASAAPAGNAQNGKRIFESYGCYQCHDHDAHGGAGARLAPNPIAFERFSRYVRHPTGDMPPYTAKVVSDQELADIYAFLETIPAPPAVKDIPILNR
jgi:mono/diheme cytochrome c family protein